VPDLSLPLRVILYCAEDLGHPKALVAARRLGVRGMAADVNAATISRQALVSFLEKYLPKRPDNIKIEIKAR